MAKCRVLVCEHLDQTIPRGYGPHLLGRYDAVSQMLAANGFPSGPPKMLAGSGWGSWSSNYFDSSLPSQRASHLMHNILGEFKDQRQRRFARAYYYYFYDFDGAGVPDSEPVKLVGIRPDGTLRLTAVYAAFEMVRELALESAQIVETSAAAPIEVMAVNNLLAPQLKVVMTTFQSEPATLDVTIEQSPLTGKEAVAAVQQIDSGRSVDGAGLESPRWQNLGVSPRDLRIEVSLPPHASVLLTVSPAKSRRRAVRPYRFTTSLKNTDLERLYEWLVPRVTRRSPIRPAQREESARGRNPPKRRQLFKTTAWHPCACSGRNGSRDPSADHNMNLAR
jgi:hypothetical protein